MRFAAYNGVINPIDIEVNCDINNCLTCEIQTISNLYHWYVIHIGVYCGWSGGGRNCHPCSLCHPGLLCVQEMEIWTI